MSVIRHSVSLVRERWLAYLGLNLVYFGFVLVGMAIAASYRPIQQVFSSTIGSAFSSGLLFTVGQIYTTGKLFQAIGITFLVNLFLGSIAEIALPSLIIPFSGIIVALFRAILWGIVFSPIPPTNRMDLLRGMLVMGVILLEGEGYVLAMFGAFLQGRSFILKISAGSGNVIAGYRQGVGQEGKVYPLVVVSLLLAALYEAFVVILVMPLLR